jgi:hypothetical protein
MNLSDIIQSAQGGQGLQNLAAEFGLSPEQTEAAMQAIIPALSHGLQRASQDPGALGGSYADRRRSARSSRAPRGSIRTSSTACCPPSPRW